MTPFELALQHELEVERRRFDSEWLFQWHKLKMEGKVVDIDRFDGGRIYLGGVQFGDQAQSIFWQALGRYLNGKVHDGFKKWDQETKSYPAASRASSLDGTARILLGFVSGTVKKGVETDQALRGGGRPKDGVPRQSNAAFGHANAEIHRLNEAHKALLALAEKKSVVSRRQSFEIWYAENKATAWIIGISVTLIGLLITAARVFLH